MPLWLPAEVTEAAGEGPRAARVREAWLEP